MKKRQDKKLVGYLAAPLPPIDDTPNYDSYIHFSKMFTDEFKTKDIPNWRKINGGQRNGTTSRNLITRAYISLMEILDEKQKRGRLIVGGKVSE